jgi:ABC-type amino acid transport system permease subunit
MIRFAIAYAAIGVIVGVVAARYALSEGDEPGSAGAVGVFIALFWPVAVLVALFGWAAQIGTKEDHP